MSRGKACSICTHPDRAQIDGLIAAGIKLKDIATQVAGVSAFALSRHRRNCLAVQSAVAAEGDNESQLALWVQRANDLYIASGAALDLRGQSAAISAAFRAMEFRFKHQERLQEQAARDLPHDPALWTSEEAGKFLAWLDSIVAEADARKETA